MFPEDRVLIAFVPTPRDFDLVREQQWYRIPLRSAPKGIYAEYLAFYFGGNFGAQKWAVHYYGRNLGHELTTRRALLPKEADHPRADDLYYKIKIGLLTELTEPIISLRWRRLAFIHTTWDRFVDAREINDLFLDGDPYVDRLFATLKERGIRAERNYRIEDEAGPYVLPLAVPCRDGILKISREEITANEDDLTGYAERIALQSAAWGGVSPVAPHSR